MTERVHKNDNYRTTGMFEVLNEPLRTHDSLIPEYYTTAYNKIKETEANLGVGDDKKLTVQFMAESWGAGNPRTAVQGKTDVAMLTVLRVISQHLEVPSLKSFTPSAIRRDDFKIIYV